MKPEIFEQTNFAVIDWVLVGVYLLVSLAVGLYVRQFASNMTAYIAAGRNVGMWLGVATMAGTELGLITVMYSAEKGFKGGFAAFHIAMLAGLVTLVVGATGFIVVPLRRMGVLTIPEFYERRFGRTARIVGAIVLTVGGILNMGLFLKVGSMFIVGVTGLSASGWALPVVMTVLLVLVLAYTILGGMISVVITDYIQFVVLSVGLVGTSVYAIYQLGWNNVFEVVQKEMGPAGFNPLVSEGAFGVEYVVWMAFLGLVSCAIWPTAIARALAMESEQAVRRQYMLSSVSFTIRFMIPYFWGICAFVFIAAQAPDLKAVFMSDGDAGESVSSLYAMPLLLGRLLPSGLLGLLSAAMIAAFMSTHDSYLLCWSSVITQDIVAPLSRGKLSEKRRVQITRWSIVAIGAYIWAWGLWYEGSDDIWDYMAVTGAVYFTGAFALLVGGLYWRRASRTGAILALCAGSTAVCGLGPIRNLLGTMLLSLGGATETGEALTARAEAIFTSPRIGLASIVATCLVFVVGSLVAPDPPASPEKGDRP